MPSQSSLRHRLAETCLELLRVPSVTGAEHDITNHLERWALSQSSLTRDDVIRHGNGLILGQAYDNKPCIGLVGHTDTVPPEENYAGVRQAEDKIYGRGASDMKGGLAVMMALYEYLDIENLPFSLLLVLYDKEEGDYASNGLQPLLESYEALSGIDLAIAMEPTDNALQLGCLGSIQARVTFRGQACHSARPWQGENAIHKAGDFLSALHAREPNEVIVAGLTFRESISATLAEGGLARNVIPDRLSLNVNARFAPPTEEGGTDAVIAATQRELIRVLGEGAEVQILDVAPPGPVPMDNPILAHLQAHANLPVEAKHGWTDVARLATFGIDSVNFGPGATSQAHQAGEWISLDALAESYDVLSKVLTAPLEGI